jgi:hypothetical protein
MRPSRAAASTRRWLMTPPRPVDPLAGPLRPAHPYNPTQACPVLPPCWPTPPRPPWVGPLGPPWGTPRPSSTSFTHPSNLPPRLLSPSSAAGSALSCPTRARGPGPSSCSLAAPGPHVPVPTHLQLLMPLSQPNCPPTRPPHATTFTTLRPAHPLGPPWGTRWGSASEQAASLDSRPRTSSILSYSTLGDGHST